jgi:hypothetical protein
MIFPVAQHKATTQGGINAFLCGRCFQLLFKTRTFCLKRQTALREDD